MKRATGLLVLALLLAALMSWGCAENGSESEVVGQCAT